MPPGPHTEDNPSDALGWWNKAKTLGLDPRQVNLTTHESHSASKFTETDFVHLKALWKNNDVDKLHISEYVRADHVKTWGFLLARADNSSEQERAKHPLRQHLREFIRASAEPLTDDEAKNAKLGAFLLTKSHLDSIKGINKNGTTVSGDIPKLRRSARVMSKRQDTVASLTEQLGSMLVDGKNSHRPKTPPKPPRTPSPKAGTEDTPGPLATRDLAVISPESMALENNRSRDEDSVNATLISILEATTLCSGIKRIGGRQQLKWHHTRQSFHLGPASNPVCEARTDGLLIWKVNGIEQCLAILEVKPYMRTWNRTKIEWQEACQMAAWISSSLGEKDGRKRKEGLLRTGNPNLKRYVFAWSFTLVYTYEPAYSSRDPANMSSIPRRVLISQDYMFLYITIAEWGRGYEEYLYGKARPPTPPSKTASPSQDRGRQEARPAATPPTARGSSQTIPSAPVKPKSGAPNVGVQTGGGRGSSPSQRLSQAQQHASGHVTDKSSERTKRTAESPSKTAAQPKDTSEQPKTAGQGGKPAAGVAAARTTASPVRKPAAVPTGPTDEEKDSGQFLTMKCYGAYETKDPMHMAMFLRNVLALMLELSDPLDP
jgi:hypothetical protein